MERLGAREEMAKSCAVALQLLLQQRISLLLLNLHLQLNIVNTGWVPRRQRRFMLLLSLQILAMKSCLCLVESLKILVVNCRRLGRVSKCYHTVGDRRDCLPRRMPAVVVHAAPAQRTGDAPVRDAWLTILS